MKKTKKMVALLLGLSLALAAFAVPACADSHAKPTSLSPVGATSKTYTTGKNFELKVRTNPADAEDDYLRWSIESGSSIVKFTDSDRSDDEVDMKALKSGSAVVKCYISGTSKTVKYNITVKNGTTTTQQLSRIGSATRTVRVGGEIDLEVKHPGISESRLDWNIVSGSKYVRFDDDRYGEDEVEIKGLKAGTAKVRCQVRGTGKYVTFTVNVKSGPAAGKISRIGSYERGIYQGREFELEVQKGKGIYDRDLSWSIDDKSIVIFEEYEKDDEIELIAKKKGTTKVHCKNLKTGGVVSFVIHVK